MRIKQLPIAICKNCGNPFGAKAFHGIDNRQKFCCKACYTEYSRINSAKITLFCDHCGRSFDVYLSRIKFGNPRFCSLECSDAHNYRGVNSPTVDRVISICEMCKKPFEHRITEKQRYCSHACANDVRLCEHPEHARLIRGSWKILRSQIIFRDGNRCAVCGKKKRWLIVHHIIPWSKVREDKPENLITLCRSCHAKVEFGQTPCPIPLPL